MRKWINIIAEIEIQQGPKLFDKMIDSELHDLIYKFYYDHYDITKNYTIPAKQIYKTEDKILLKKFVLRLREQIKKIEMENSQMVIIVKNMVNYFVHGRYNFD